LRALFAAVPLKRAVYSSVETLATRAIQQTRRVRLTRGVSIGA
jgi:hypothetical protein